jgi:cell division protein ZapE
MAADESQAAAVARLAEYDRETSADDRCSIQPWAYIYGPVGSGKTLLLDHYAAHAQAQSISASAGAPGVLRAHFHDFLLSVHARLAELEKSRPRRVRKTLSGLDVYEFGEAEGTSAVDTLAYVASSLRAAHHTICLDELCVTDLVDALILGRLARALLAEGVRLVFTSNQPPGRLFESGANRTRYVGELAALLRTRSVPIRVGIEGRDYRSARAASAGVARPGDEPPDARTVAYRASGRFLLAEGGDAAFETEWSARTAAHGEARLSVPIAFQRRLIVRRAAGGAMRARFDELCGAERGAADYLALARAFDALYLEAVPALGPKAADEARRLITLVDVCYDEHVRLVIHSRAPREAIFAALRDGVAGPEGAAAAEGELRWMITRCMSRLAEMTPDPRS